MNSPLELASVESRYQLQCFLSTIAIETILG